MANTVSIQLEIEGTFDQLVKIKDFVRSPEEEFSFEKVNPMPEEIKAARESTNPSNQYQKYVTWLYENWGCLEADFITCRFDNPHFLNYHFHTKSNSPNQVIQRLSSHFPEAIIVMYMEDEFDLMRAMDGDHRGVYGIPVDIYCNGKRIQTFTYPKIDFYELRKLEKETRVQI